MRKLAPLGVFLGVVTVTAVAFLPVCSLLHRCGCEAPWAGGAGRCNVHNARGPHCPWCEHPLLGALAMGATIGAQALTLLAVRRRRGSTLQGALAAIAVLPVGFVLSGAATWLATDYPHFIVGDARVRIGLPNGPLKCVVTPSSRAGAGCCSR